MTVAGMEALRAKANVQGRADAIEQFRADFKAVWRQWRAAGEITEQELSDGYAEAASAIQSRKADKGWMDCAAAHFRQMAQDRQADQSRSERIRAEMASAKEAA
jgi:hypothetical protein